MKPQDLFRGSPLLCDMPTDQVRELSRYCVMKSFTAGEVVIRQGDTADGLYGLLTGRLSVSFETAEGREMILTMLMPGALFGEMALLDGGVRSTTVTARDASTVLFIARHIFLPFLYRHPELVLRLAVHLSTLVRRGTGALADVTLLSTPQRLAKTLVALADAGAARTSIAVSQDELSRILGVSREVVNRQLALWRDCHYVTLARGRIVLLDAGAIRRIAETGEVPAQKRCGS